MKWKAPVQRFRTVIEPHAKLTTSAFVRKNSINQQCVAAGGWRNYNCHSEQKLKATNSWHSNAFAHVNQDQGQAGPETVGCLGVICVRISTPAAIALIVLLTANVVYSTLTQHCANLWLVRLSTTERNGRTGEMGWNAIRPRRASVRGGATAAFREWAARLGNASLTLSRSKLLGVLLH